MKSVPRFPLLVLGVVAATACAAGTNNTFTTTGTATGGSGSGNSGTGTGTGASGMGGNIGLGGSIGTGTGGTGGSSPGVTYAYAHTNTTLYKFDPTQAAISMTQVGTFDCIGSSSSGGTSSGAPTTCAQANNGIGCCDGNTEYYCSSGAVKSSTCSSGQVCTWNASKSYYGCGTGPAMSGSGQPLACPGTGSSSSSGGTTSQDSSMTDIAVDSKGNLWGVSAHNAYELEIQGSTVHCAKTIPLVGVPTGVVFYALSFVPSGVIDPSAETLLAGDTQGDLWRIDTTSGALEQHGNFGTVPANDGQGHTYPSDSATTGSTTTVGTPWQLSGDILFVADSADGGSGTLGFATVRDCVGTTCSNTDTLIQIDPTKLGAAGTTVTGNVTLGLRGQVVKSASCTDTVNKSYGKTFGIAAWNSTIYGLSHSSYIVEIDNNTGAACAVSGTNTAQAWSGAAVTTIAPVSAPPPPNVQ